LYVFFWLEKKLDPLSMISELQKTTQLVVMVVMASSTSSLLKAATVTFYENNGSLLDVCGAK
jgi:hypothetical protein